MEVPTISNYSGFIYTFSKTIQWAAGSHSKFENLLVEISMLNSMLINYLIP